MKKITEHSGCTSHAYERVDDASAWECCQRCDAVRAATPSQATADIDAMVNRFLAWRLPDNFGPDAGIQFTPSPFPHAWPVGTNLLTADQARAMFEHVCNIAAPRVSDACTCPSGDGSLRWPCPTHPPQADHARIVAEKELEVEQLSRANAEIHGHAMQMYKGKLAAEARADTLAVVLRDIASASEPDGVINQAWTHKRAIDALLSEAGK